jgi:hypothetical protein
MSELPEAMRVQLLTIGFLVRGGTYSRFLFVTRSRDLACRVAAF